MKEASIVRQNLMDDIGYRPYCGNDVQRNTFRGCSNPRTIWDPVLSQFRCLGCGWTSDFDKDFIDRYKAKHNINT